MDYLEIWVPSPPVPQQRAIPNFDKHGRYCGKHDDPVCIKYKREVRDAAVATAKSAALRRYGKAVPLGGAFFFYLPRVIDQAIWKLTWIPSGGFKRCKTNKTRKVKRKGKYPIARGCPDNDNLYKGAADAMEEKREKDKRTGFTYTVEGLYINDTQFIDTVIRKRFVDDDALAGCLIRLWAVTENEYAIPYQF